MVLGSGTWFHSWRGTAVIICGLVGKLLMAQVSGAKRKRGGKAGKHTLPKSKKVNIITAATVITNIQTFISKVIFDDQVSFKRRKQQKHAATETSLSQMQTWLPTLSFGGVQGVKATSIAELFGKLWPRDVVAHTHFVTEDTLND